MSQTGHVVCDIGMITCAHMHKLRMAEGNTCRESPGLRSALIKLCALDIVGGYDADSAIHTLCPEPVVIHFVQENDALALRNGQVACLSSLEAAIMRAQNTYVYRAVASPRPDEVAAVASAGDASAGAVASMDGTAWAVSCALASAGSCSGPSLMCFSRQT